MLEGLHVSLFALGLDHEKIMFPETPSGMAILGTKDVTNGYRDDQSRNDSTAAPMCVTGTSGDLLSAASRSCCDALRWRH